MEGIEAKLIKNVVGEYHLIVDKCPTFVSISEPVTNGFVIASDNHYDPDFLKLSTKNCQAIERGYDLDELADILLVEVQTPHKLNQPNTFRRGVIKGFQKALELMGDKKFTEKDLDNAFECGYEMFDSTGKYNDILVEFKKSLQQNEWEVEILDERDSEGRLILKRAV